MKRHLKKFRFGPAIFVGQMPRFICLYVRSRSWWLLLSCLPLFAVAVLVCFTVRYHSSGQYRAQLFQDYSTSLKQAVSERRFEDADLYFERCRSLADDSTVATYDYAAALYSSAAVESPQRDRALSLMQSIAPRKRTRPGSTNAHRFLADYWKNEADVSHVSSVLAFQHLSCAEPDNPVYARQLANYVLSLGYKQHAIDFLLPFSNDPESLILLSRCHLQNNDQKAATTALDSAVELQQSALTSDPANRSLRIRLGQTLAARGLPMQSFFVLAAGLDSHPDPLLSDHLVQTYVAWLNNFNQAERSLQLEQIAMALRIKLSSLPNKDSQPTTANVNSVASVTLSSGEDVSLPLPIVRFHEALTSNDREWLVPLLRSSEEIQRGNIEEAIRLLRSTLSIVPAHPVALNNLAWILYQDSVAKQQPADSDVFVEAQDLASQAIATDSENPAYRQTRAVIAFLREDWATAVDDLQKCTKANYRYSETLPLLKRAKAALNNHQSVDVD